MELTSKQRAQLRGMASTLDTIVHVGKDGIGENLIKQVNDALEARELIKGRVLENSMLTAREAAEELKVAARCEVVQVIGSKFVLMTRPSGRSSWSRTGRRACDMKIGIYGGTFDPIHRGHITAAQAAAQQLGLDLLLLIPASIPPHKALPEGGADAAQRLEMATLATAELSCPAQVLDVEVRRQGKSYTADTLRTLRQQYPEDELWLLMGTDMFLSLQDWREPQEILRLVRVAAFSRTGDPEQQRFARQKAYLEETFGAQVTVVENPHVVDISSTRLRQLLPEGREYLPEAVYGYILRQRLYGTHAELKHLTPEELRPIALSFLKPKRMPHVLGTEQEAIRLARRYGADETDARIAALLHDCTKKLDMEQQLALCRRYDIRLDELEQHALKLLHAKTGAAVARDIFGVKDAVYEAIRWHTTGKPDMTLLEKVIYLADYIEPNRDFPGVDELRRAVYDDLDKGLLMGLSDTIDEMERMGNPVHHDTLEARDFLLRGEAK